MWTERTSKPSSFLMHYTHIPQKHLLAQNIGMLISSCQPSFLGLWLESHKLDSQSSRSSGIRRASTETCKQSISYMILKCNIWLVKCGTNLVPRYVVWEIKQLELPTSLGDTTQSRVIGLRNSAEHGLWQCLSLRSTTTQHCLYLHLMNGPDFVPPSPWICWFSALIHL